MGARSSPTNWVASQPRERASLIIQVAEMEQPTSRTRCGMLLVRIEGDSGWTKQSEVVNSSLHEINVVNDHFSK